MNLATRPQTMPPCCANCRLASWCEDGLRCHHPSRQNGTVENGDPPVHFWHQEYPEPGVIDWDTVCDLHDPGRPFTAFTDQEHADLEAMRAAEVARRVAVFADHGLEGFP
jgi:hypothetical protein